jgi:thiol-disulfide isomerase/thioredoxin
MMYDDRMRMNTFGTILGVPQIPTSDHIDDTWTFQSVDGVTRRLSDFQGNVLVINYWATWCGPCRKEMPALSRLYKRIKGQRIELLCLTPEDPRNVRIWLDTHPNDLPLYAYKILPPAQLAWVALPTTYIVNKAGRVAYRFDGAAQWDDDGVVDSLLEMSR